ncbi:MMPL family transporter [Micrococcoides hystricis]|uniref:MMPL family transporter n=1 Tax=Micrococcoides hystricis TaxID=1572761 RepID=A0ABV6P9T1_9MICC
MASLLYSLGAWCARHAKTVIGLWLVILVGVGALALNVGKGFSTQYDIPGSEYEKVIEYLDKKLPEDSGGTGTLAFKNTAGGSFSQEQQQQITDLLNELENQPAVREVTNPFTAQADLEKATADVAEAEEELQAPEEEIAEGRKQVTEGREELQKQREELQDSYDQLPEQLAEQLKSDPDFVSGIPAIDGARQQLAQAEAQLDASAKELDEAEEQLASGREELALGKRQLKLTEEVSFLSGDTARGAITFTKEPHNLEPAEREAVTEAIEAAKLTDIETYPGVEITQDVSEVVGASEGVGVIVAAIVLFVALGSVVAAGLPLITALIGSGIGLAGIFALTSTVQMTSTDPALALMLGLGLGIDYALLIVHRHRRQMMEGEHLIASIARANGTAGTSVFFAGVINIIGLSALTVTGIPFLSVMGLAAGGTIAVVVAATLMLVPAALKLIGHRVIPKSKLVEVARNEVYDKQDLAIDQANRGWGAFVTNHPWLMIGASVLILAIVAIPAFSLRLGLPMGNSEPRTSDGYKNYQLIAENYGTGFNGPLLSVVELQAGLDETEREEKTLDIAEDYAARADVLTAIPATESADGTVQLLQIIPAHAPDTEATENLVHDLRDGEAALGEKHDVTVVGYAGQTVANIDISDKVAGALPLYLTIVIALSLLLLTMIFRSIWAPVMASAGFLLSVGAAFGAVVAIYQWGWLGPLFGVHDPTAVLSFLPILLIGVLFGLSVDYQIFIVSGMREAWTHGLDSRTSVRLGYRQGGAVVTAAGIIMVSVFAGFIFSGVTMIRPIGFGLAFGVLVDAFLIRTTFIPAVMHLFGKHAWWLPRWMDKIMPDMDVEGAKLEAKLDAHRNGKLEGR